MQQVKQLNNIEKEMSNIMKSTMRNVSTVIILALLPALVGAAQVGAVDYKITYKGQTEERNNGYIMQTTAPAVSFQSTSVYATQENSEEQPSILNTDGTVNEAAYTGNSRLRRPGSVRTEEREGGTGTAGEGDIKDKQTDTPIGDAVVPLMLLACAFGMFVYFRRKRSEA